MVAELVVARPVCLFELIGGIELDVDGRSFWSGRGEESENVRLASSVPCAALATDSVRLNVSGLYWKTIRLANGLVMSRPMMAPCAGSSGPSLGDWVAVDSRARSQNA